MKKCETCEEHNCYDCEVPQIEPEDCEDCRKQSEKDSVEYEANFTHKNGYWECEHCRKPV